MHRLYAARLEGEAAISTSFFLSSTSHLRHIDTHKEKLHSPVYAYVWFQRFFPALRVFKSFLQFPFT